MKGRLRFKSRRPSFRRGGLVLSSSAFVEIATDELAREQLLALLSDPVVIVEGEVEGDWVKASDEQRAAGVAWLKAQASAEQAPVEATPTEELPPELATTIQAIATMIAPPPPPPPVDGAQVPATPAGDGASTTASVQPAASADGKASKPPRQPATSSSGKAGAKRAPAAAKGSGKGGPKGGK